VIGDFDKGDVKAREVSIEASVRAKLTMADWNFIVYLVISVVVRKKIMF
jgi:hypothetical protein